MEENMIDPIPSPLSITFVKNGIVIRNDQDAVQIDGPHGDVERYSTSEEWEDLIQKGPIYAVQRSDSDGKRGFIIKTDFKTIAWLPNADTLPAWADDADLVFGPSSMETGGIPFFPLETATPGTVIFPTERREQANNEDLQKRLNDLPPGLLKMAAQAVLGVEEGATELVSMQVGKEVITVEAASAPYGNVSYADPGHQKDGKKRYPIDTAEHVRAAWSYINQKDNAAKYSSADLSSIKAAIVAAAKKFNITINKMVGDWEYQFTKQADESRFTYGPMYIPDKVDAHGEWTDATELEKAVWWYSENAPRDINLQHQPDVKAGKWLELNIWRDEHVAKMSLPGRGVQEHRLPAGTAYMGVVWEPWAWDLIKQGQLRGLSIEGVANRMEVEFVAPPDNTRDVRVLEQ